MSVVTSTFQSAVAAAVRDFRSALGDDRVLTGEDQLDEFRDPFQFASWDEFTPSAVAPSDPGRRRVPASGHRGGEAGLRRVPRAPGLHGSSVRAVLVQHHACRRFCETIKDAIDPQGILSPGKQGIWPAAMRPRRSSEA